MPKLDKNAEHDAQHEEFKFIGEDVKTKPLAPQRPQPTVTLPPGEKKERLKRNLNKFFDDLEPKKIQKTADYSKK